MVESNMVAVVGIPNIKLVLDELGAGPTLVGQMAAQPLMVVQLLMADAAAEWWCSH
jgi:hypothetical protein